MITEGPVDLPQADAWRAAIRIQALERLAATRGQPPRYSLIGALALLIALHAVLLWRWYSSRLMLPPLQPTVLQVRLIDESVPPQSMPPHLALPQQSRRAIAPPPRSVPPAPMAAALLHALPPRPVLFNHDGTVLAPQARFVSPQEAGIARGGELLARGHNIIHCRRSRFDNSPTAAEPPRRRREASTWRIW